LVGGGAKKYRAFQRGDDYILTTQLNYARRWIDDLFRQDQWSRLMELSFPSGHESVFVDLL
jgi:hypothetical protein